MNEASGLVGARIQRIDGPRPNLFAFTLHRADLRGCLLLSTSETRPGVGWVEKRPRGAPASAFVRFLRKRLENGRITAAHHTRDETEIVVQRGETQAVLRLDPKAPNLIVAIDGQVAGALHPNEVDVGRAYTALEASLPLDLTTLQAKGGALLTALTTDARELRASAIAELIDRRLRQLRRRLRAIEGDLSRVDEVATLRHHASLLLAHLSAIPKGANEVTVTDWNADPPAPLRIAIDPLRGARGEAEALFRRARKLERGGEIALTRYSETEHEIEKLESLKEALAGATEATLDVIEREAARLGARPQRVGGPKANVPRRPYRTFRGTDDRAILVGRSAKDNDALTVKVARPHDHWLHARSVAGSHVVVPLRRGEQCPPALLLDAAHLAAHFSEYRGEPLAEIQHTARRYVRKPRGSAPGAVVLSEEKVLLLRVEPERLARLLAAEDHG